MLKHWFGRVHTPVRRTLASPTGSGAIYTGLGHLALAGLIVAIGALVARVATVGVAGRYFLAMAIANGIAIVVSAGTHRGVIRVTARPDLSPLAVGYAVRRAYLMVALFSLVVTALLVSPVGSALFSVFELDVGLSPLYIGLTSGMRSVGLLRSEVYRARQSYGFAALFRGVDAALVLAVILLIAPMFSDDLPIRLQTLLLFTCLGWVPGTIAAVHFDKSLRFERDRLREEDRSVKQHLSISMLWPIWASAVATFFAIKFDVWFAGATLPDDAVGHYTAAARLAPFVAFPAVVVNGVVPPLIVRLYEQGRLNALQDAVHRYTRLASMLALPILLAVVLLSGSVMTYTYGPAYVAGSPVLALLAFGYAFEVFTGPSGYVLTMTGREQYQLWATLAGSGLLLLLLIWRSPSTVTELALLTLLVTVGKQLIIWWLARQTVGVSTSRLLEFVVRSRKTP